MDEHAPRGPGSRTLLAELFSYARAMAHPIVGFEELYLQAVDRGVPRRPS